MDGYVTWTPIHPGVEEADNTCHQEDMQYLPSGAPGGLSVYSSTACDPRCP